ncbi:winged helix-turn-helix transcriptional regulator [Natronorubrum texcoconense]|uniref:winged helix-turn-helix transcriptional regulator n=1 Tax=Natronorubrum texcoconense TaxID=1095776 RepID=UPI000B7DF831|nr:winged helix-turn-helix transcriptional regulator [Natronorubrum texcoconense]
MTPTVLSQRLSELADADSLERRSDDESPPHVEYEPTETATELPRQDGRRPSA